MWRPRIPSSGRKPCAPPRLELQSYVGVSMVTLHRIKLIIESTLQLRDLASKRRSITYVTARYFFFKIAEEHGYGVVIIGKCVNRDHSTVVHGLKKFKDYYQTERKFRDNYQKVRTAVTQSVNKQSE